ncbi:DUF2637 domain-containing protein [Streptomyces sp. NPDC088752]|uniref:DUF2637 domain-containing protein n=1 Tax=Streptomyces sp. NPDC088752 TaxID=3154963 RepID=UPI00343E91B4
MALLKRTRNHAPASAPTPHILTRLTDVDWGRTLNDALIYLLAVGGFYLGFSTLYDLALKVGYTTDQALVAAALADIAIFAYSRKALQEVKAGRPAWGIRLIVTVFSLATFALQLRSAWPHPTAVAFHAMAPAVWVIGHEMMLRGNLRDARKALKQQQITDGLRPAPLPRIRASHWLLDPLRTLRVWRLTKLWEVPQHVVIRQLADDLIDSKKKVPTAWQGALLAPQAPPAKAAKDMQPPTSQDYTQPSPPRRQVIRNKPSGSARGTLWRSSLRTPRARRAPIAMSQDQKDMHTRFLDALPEPPAEGRSKEEALAYIERVKQVATEFGQPCKNTFLAELLRVDPTYISRIHPARKLVPAGT